MPRLRQTLLVTLALFAALGMAAGAHAGLIASDTKDFGGERAFHKSYTHDLTGSFPLGTAQSATLEIVVSDDDKCDLEWWCEEWIPLVVLVVVEDLDFDTGGLSYGTFSSGLEMKAFAVLNETGTLSWKIAAVNDFLLHSATVNVYGDNVSVPEPGTLGLLGAGLLGMGLIRRRKQRV